MGDSEGVKKVSELIMKDGRSLIITKKSIAESKVPNGTLFCDGEGPYTETEKQIMIKNSSSDSWSIINPENIFLKGSIVNSLISDKAIWTRHINPGSITKACLDDNLKLSLDSSIHIESDNTININTSTPVIFSMYGDIVLKDKVVGTAPKVNRKLTIEGNIVANNMSVNDITANNIELKKLISNTTISAKDSISTLKDISAGTSVSANTLSILTTANIGEALTVGSLKSLGNIESLKDINTKGNITTESKLQSASIKSSGAAEFGNLVVNNEAKLQGALELNGALIAHSSIVSDMNITANTDIISKNGSVSSFGDVLSSTGNIISKSGAVKSYGDIITSNGNIISSTGYVSAATGLMVKKGGLNVQNGGATITGNVEVDGTITATKLFNASFGDLAEAYIPAEDSQPGDILEITDDFKVRKARENSTAVIGVHSDCYAQCFLATDSEIKSKKKVAIGLIGQAPIKIMGIARIGELVVSAGYGIGKTVPRNKIEPGTVVGKVLENKNYEGLGLVMCFIFPS